MPPNHSPFSRRPDNATAVCGISRAHRSARYPCSRNPEEAASFFNSAPPASILDKVNEPPRISGVDSYRKRRFSVKGASILLFEQIKSASTLPARLTPACRLPLFSFSFLFLPLTDIVRSFAAIGRLTRSIKTHGERR